VKKQNWTVAPSNSALLSPSSRSIYKPHSVKRGLLASAIISLGHASPHDSCSLPETSASGFAPENSGDEPPPTRRFCPCSALLQMGVTWLHLLPDAPVVSYTTFSPLPGYPGGLFLWPNPVGYPTPGVTRHRALWSADFPLEDSEESTSDRPTDLDEIIILLSWANVN